MNKFKIKKYDIMLYTSLLAAILCIVIAGFQYFNSASNTSNSLKEEVKYAIKEMNNEKTLEEYVESEPDIMQKIDKQSIINTKLKNITKGIETDSILSQNIIKTWKNYKVVEIKYQREIAENYYAYEVDIQVNKDAVIPVNENNTSTDEYAVFTLIFNITYSQRDNEYIVKLIEIPNK